MPQYPRGTPEKYMHLDIYQIWGGASSSLNELPPKLLLTPMTTPVQLYCCRLI